MLESRVTSAENVRGVVRAISEEDVGEGAGEDVGEGAGGLVE
jgi:hypothetical protein